MKTHTAQPLFRGHGITSIPAHRRLSFHRLRIALTTLSRAVADLCRARRDRARLLRMTERELRDVGLHRIEVGTAVRVVSLADAGA